MNGLKWMGMGLAIGLIATGCSEARGGKGDEAGACCPGAGKDAAAGAVCPVGGQGKGAATCPVPDKGAGAIAGQSLVEGVALQTLVAGQYVYVEVQTSIGTVWVAGPKQEVAKGDRICCPTGMLMEKFDSPILKRTFDKVYFVETLKAVQVESAPPAANNPEILAAHAKASKAVVIDTNVSVALPAGGVTIDKLVTDKDKLKGQAVLVRAKVTKFSAAIMDANWLHVVDGSAKRDLVVTTQSECKVGDTVLIKGKLECDVDLGYGYAYDVIVRNADVTVEK